MRLSLSLLPWLAYPSEKTRVDKPHTRDPWLFSFKIIVCIRMNSWFGIPIVTVRPFNASMMPKALSQILFASSAIHRI
jgi:hypothetical protein